MRRRERTRYRRGKGRGKKRICFYLTNTVKFFFDIKAYVFFFILILHSLFCHLGAQGVGGAVGRAEVHTQGKKMRITMEERAGKKDSNEE